MRVNYCGNRDKFWNGKRYAEVSCEEYEDERKEATCRIMADWGWEIDYSVEGWAACEIEDKQEYEYFMEDWKKAKRMTKGL